MRKLLFLLVIPGFLFLTQCKKIENPSNSGTSIENMKVSEKFNWKMTSKYSFTVTGQSMQVITIKTIDGNNRLYKCNIEAGKTQISFNLFLPTFLKEVLVNDHKVSLSQGIIEVNLSPVKSTLLTNYNLVFDGTDDYIDLGDIAELNNVSAFTIEGWTLQTTNTDPEYIFSKAGGISDDIRVRTAIGALEIEIGNGADAFGSWAGYSATIPSGTWFHWAIVFDGSGLTNADRLKLYINGNTTPIVLAFTGTIPVTTSASLSGINALLSSALSPLGGKMDEIRIWSIARTATEINDNFQKLVPGTSANLVACWRMNENSGSTILDETLNNYDGTIFGCTWNEESMGFDSDGDGILDENDDFPTDPLVAHSNYYPVSGTGTLVFEDLWPGKGDFDFNDLVLGYRFNILTNAADKVVRVVGTFTGRANGALQLNGFAFQLPDAVFNTSDVTVTGYGLHSPSIITLDGNGFESGQSKPTVVVFENNYDYMGGFVNTQLGKPYVTPFVLNITMTVNSGSYTAADFGIDTWNPFLIINLTRGYELHLKNYPPTDLVNPAYFGLADDASDPLIDQYYVTKTFIPWALDFPVYFDYATEMANFTEAYLHFQAWAESNGTLYPDWYSNTGAGYRTNSIIYSH